ncbi:hypothetical protein BU251_04930 [Candidatus Velamenicoccus archaeovorus]|uniref:Uncharacterized protein n=1 Tax=Velamenicoccus archaeovorus TaxID=1930593 RepID=A0A410P4S3_VELA1|nr:hypothetical protein BU251_04930 [Candidatus Velamenicoccus archaeovorus]
MLKNPCLPAGTLRHQNLFDLFSFKFCPEFLSDLFLETRGSFAGRAIEGIGGKIFPVAKIGI